MTTIKRVALVTGGNRGIGFEICRQLAATGVEVVLGARESKKAQSAADLLAAESISVKPQTLDVTSPESIQDVVTEIEAEEGRLDILVNNAGIFLDKDGKAETIDLDRVRLTMETNTYGPILLCQAAIPLMRRQGYGRIVNLASELGSLTNMETLYPAYRMSKTALICLHPGPGQRADRDGNPRQRHVPGLGQDRDGRTQRHPRDRRLGRHRPLAGDTAR